MGRPSKFIIGEKYGTLEIREIISNNESGKHVNLRCFCEGCEKEKIINGANLRKSQSCGCQQRNSYKWKNKAGPKNMPWQLESGKAARNTLEWSYKNGAVKRKLNYELTSEEFDELIVGNCFYCGDIDTNIKKGQGKTSGDFLYTGIDRLNSELGYTKDNCVSCCWTCNNMKTNFSVDYFLNQIIKIYNNKNKEK